MTQAAGRFAIDAGAELGSGGYGKVYTASDKTTGERVAAKLISVTRMKLTAIEKELKLMEQLGGHEHVIGLRGFEEQPQHVIIYMELAPRGELFGRVISAGALREDEARPYFTQVLKAVEFMHQEGVVHRDLKLENVLLGASDECKVCDFGLAHVYPVGADGQPIREPLREICGSKSYCAPEVLAGKGYDGPPADVWSCAICLFGMLAGFFPLDEASGADWRFERVKMAAQGNYSVVRAIFGFYDRECPLSDEVVNLLDGMLDLSPPRRISVAAALSSPWVSGGRLAAASAPMGEAPVYRTLNLDSAKADYDASKVAAMFGGDESNSSAPPVYRGGPPLGPPPSLAKQEPMFCDAFHNTEA